MRLQNYIIENTDLSTSYHPEQLAEVIVKSSKKYLKLLKGKQPLFRGIWNVRGNNVGVKDVRQDRNPQGTDKHTFDFVNKWLKKKGWPRRDKSFMTTSEEEHTKQFSEESFYVFPLGNAFKYGWIRADDFNDTNLHGSKKSDWDEDNLESLVNSGSYEAAENMLNNYVHGNEGFDTAYREGYEIWFDSKKYLYINREWLDNGPSGVELRKELKKRGVNL